MLSTRCWCWKVRALGLLHFSGQQTVTPQNNTFRGTSANENPRNASSSNNTRTMWACCGFITNQKWCGRTWRRRARCYGCVVSALRTRSRTFRTGSDQTVRGVLENTISLFPFKPAGGETRSQETSILPVFFPLRCSICKGCVVNSILTFCC